MKPTTGLAPGLGLRVLNRGQMLPLVNTTECCIIVSHGCSARDAEVACVALCRHICFILMLGIACKVNKVVTVEGGSVPLIEDLRVCTATCSHSDRQILQHRIITVCRLSSLPARRGLQSFHATAITTGNSPAALDAVHLCNQTGTITAQRI
jgi:hypothetical protein